MAKQAVSLLFGFCLLILLGCTSPATPTPVAEEEGLTFGLILVGPLDDRGWSEAHYNGGKYVEAHLPQSKMMVLDKLNAGDRPETTVEKAVDDMVAEGARLILLTSDEFAADTTLVAEKYPDVVFVQITGDHTLQGNAPANVGNYMGRMVYGKAIAGCAAALQTETGKIGYLGPLINDETRRLTNAAYLGARYCYQNFRGDTAGDIAFQVEWVGYWFHIPGVTADPVRLAHGLFDGGVDVILSGIDTMEATAVTSERAAAGENVRVIPYDYEGACAEAPSLCLGVPYFNWGPGYLQIAEEVEAGTWSSSWRWVPPDWGDLNNPDTSPIGFKKGDAMTTAQSAQLDQFIAGLADGSITIFTGPLNFQDGSTYLAAGETATDEEIWYMPQLLQGMAGLSE